ncbi:hypothetical protein BaRGS_00000886 [Batillaria attramentaria]|uniref:Uncharacterized protein n=1 Tax=Batillaria attramentaria TaxID=370345 RepID=A0ABD0M949_9CAEN
MHSKEKGGKRVWENSGIWLVCSSSGAQGKPQVPLPQPLVGGFQVWGSREAPWKALCEIREGCWKFLTRHFLHTAGSLSVYCQLKWR